MIMFLQRLVSSILSVIDCLEYLGLPIAQEVASLNVHLVADPGVEHAGHALLPTLLCGMQK
jgi:hypothetical protein